jgi:predicted GNAT superfamily acetyltransferase
MSDVDIKIRECETIDDFKQCIELERAVWNDEDLGIMPIRLYMISKACEAPTIGAFDGEGKIVGFVHTMLALVGKFVAYHSHLAAVQERLRHNDIGFRMKLAQRDHAIKAGIRLIFWTFDPLSSRNAHLNINKLGAIIRRYEENYYGEGLSSVFDPDIPSDRVFAEWWVSSPHVQATLDGKRPEIEASTKVAIPDDIVSVRSRAAAEHLRWRLQARAGFKDALATGQIVRGFRRDAERGESYYLFGPDDEQFRFETYESIATL